MTDNVSSTVITGRRINGPESPEPLTGTNFAVDSACSSANRFDLTRSRSFTSRSPSCCSASFIRHCALWSPGLRGLRAAGGLSRVRRRRYSCSRRKRKLARDNNGLASFYTALDDREVAVLTLAGCYRTKIDSVVGFDHEHKRPALANLHGLRRDKRCVLERVQNETDTHKFRRPQRAIGIRRDPAGFHCSGTGLYCVIDEIQVAHARCDRAVGQVGLHFHVWSAEIFSHQRQIVLRHGEVGINRVEALNRYEWRSRGSN